MKMMIKCREAAALVLRGEDRRLSLPERLSLRFHLLICKACTRFVGQVALMHSAMGPWRAYRAEGSDE